ncbi:hypothetical protein BU23DRAFT_601892 [Bimuria novae-zelandiae CBS 107.79]|uniref:Uncharacterized protein n=1 Tax=Bimuria novae-zelandiae CBS 107.79 TaxID=1447943 RepID=A0A6A5UW00_9PLEO|nr:hypothetical protein BU23DRAFT_601892 [Bimuria novae-zelandiae CBS 107.79]
MASSAIFYRHSPPETTPTPHSPGSNVIEKPPAIIPSPEFQPVTVVPAASIPPPPSHPPVAIGSVAAAATFLQGYCSEPAYTIIDGPTAVWMPVVGCISSKGDCCPTPPPSKNMDGPAGQPTGEAQGGDAQGGDAQGGDAQGGQAQGGQAQGGQAQGGQAQGGGKDIAQFPMSLLPSQGTLTGCPKDYHTIDGTACCPSNYWLWSTTLGGQVPCYSSLAARMTPPPIPDTLVNQLDTITSGDTDAASGAITITGSNSRIPSHRSTSVSALTMSQKPTSAIVNIVYTMQYPLDPPKPALKPGAKIGIGVGASAGAIFMGFIVWFLVRRIFVHRRTKEEVQTVEQTSVSHRFSSGVDMSRVAHEVPAVPGRNYRGKRYTGVSSSAVNY